MNDDAITYLSAMDPILGELIAKVGPCRLIPDRARSPFQALVQAVAHQQLNGKAANTILARFIALFPHGRFPSAQEVVGRLVNSYPARALAARRAGATAGA